MAVRNILVDDIDGTESKDIETVVFGVHGAWYEVDLSKKNQKALDDALAPFLGVARKHETQSTKKTTRRSSGAKATGEDLEAIRAWAWKNNILHNGKEVAKKGRIADSVKDAYYEAHTDVKRPE